MNLNIVGAVTIIGDYILNVSVGAFIILCLQHLFTCLCSCESYKLEIIECCPSIIW